jgi:CRISPR-associated protein Csb2
MVRHAARRAAEASGWPSARVNSIVLGHSEAEAGAGAHVPVGARRFAFLPLPSIEWRGDGETVGPIRRVLVTSFSDELGDEIAWARKSLSGQELIDERSRQPVALLALAPSRERAVGRYLSPATNWATVSPVVLPGFDDPAHCRRRVRRGVSADEQKQLLSRLDARIDGLLRKAIEHAGFPRELAQNAALEWRESAFVAGVDSASRFGVPDHLARFTRLHVRLIWRDARGAGVALDGPICIGGGRYYGLGLFRSCDPS